MNWLNAKTFARTVLSVHQRMANSHPKLRRGIVWCKRCGRSEKVDPAECLRHLGWPKCCGETMTIDAPTERSRPPA